MTRYYFNIRQGDTVQTDRSGQDLTDLNAARAVAAKATLALLNSEDKAMTGAVVEICDASRRIVATVPVDKAAGNAMPAAGPHAKASMTDEEKTPGTGMLAEQTIDGDADPGAG